MTCLITNHHFINEQYYNQNKKINLLINDDNEIKIIDINKKRNHFFRKNYDIALIELKESDKFQNFIELDENLFVDKENVYYVRKSFLCSSISKRKKCNGFLWIVKPI